MKPNKNAPPNFFHLYQMEQKICISYYITELFIPIQNSLTTIYSNCLSYQIYSV